MQKKERPLVLKQRLEEIPATESLTFARTILQCARLLQEVKFRLLQTTLQLSLQMAYNTVLMIILEVHFQTLLLETGAPLARILTLALELPPVATITSVCSK